MSLLGRIVNQLGINQPATEAEIAEDLNVRLCNCAECRKLLVAIADFPKFRNECLRVLGEYPHELRAVAAKIKDRPYCWNCLETKR